MRDENADTADKQANDAQDNDPVGDTNESGVTRRLLFVRHVGGSGVLRVDSKAE
jgi:hypothetical protein